MNARQISCPRCAMAPGWLCVTRRYTVRRRVPHAARLWTWLEVRFPGKAGA